MRTWVERMILCIGFRSGQFRSLSSIACPVWLTSFERSGSTHGSAHNFPDDSRGEEPSIHRDTLAGNISGRGKAEECN